MQVPTVDSSRLHVFRERDVGLFSLVQQIIANIPWALSEDRVPVAYFWDHCAYWTSEGFEGKENVWEYYFEPLVTGMGEDSLPSGLREQLHRQFPDPFGIGYQLEEPADVYVSNNFGDHKSLRGKALTIPYTWDDPDLVLRRQTEPIVRRHIRPRGHLRARVEGFCREQMDGRPVVGVHIRGTDATSNKETRAYRQGSLVFERYVEAIERQLDQMDGARVFVATDAEASLDRMRAEFGDRVIAFDSLRDDGSGEAAGEGPTGWTMPGYVAADSGMAARNGAEAVIEYILLSRCDHLVHNGAGLARTVLLTRADLPHTNAHGGGRVRGHLLSLGMRASGLFGRILGRS